MSSEQIIGISYDGGKTYARVCNVTVADLRADVERTWDYALTVKGTLISRVPRRGIRHPRDIRKAARAWFNERGDE